MSANKIQSVVALTDWNEHSISEQQPHKLTDDVCISIVTPCYNESEVIDIFLLELVEILKKTNHSYEIVLVDDGSTDSTYEKLVTAKELYPEIEVIKLSRNFGKEAALTAGLDQAKGEVIIPIDSDLQDPVELIPQFIQSWKAGNDVVVAKRVCRDTDSFVKRTTAKWFYGIHNKISQTKIPDNVGDYRLITRKVLTSIQRLPENQRFMKGIFSWVGYKTDVIEYKRENRQAGETSFNGWSLWNLAIDGITSFSTVPLRIWLYIGMTISSISFIYGLFIITRTLFIGVDLPGYASLLTVVLFLGGVQLMGVGVLGEYIGRIYSETKRRPVYIIDDQREEHGS